MKKSFIYLAMFCVVLVAVSSCKSHERCPAYNKAAPVIKKSV